MLTNGLTNVFKKIFQPPGRKNISPSPPLAVLKSSSLPKPGNSRPELKFGQILTKEMQMFPLHFILIKE